MPRRTTALIVLTLGAWWLAAGVAKGTPTSCSYAGPYPGDSAAKAGIAAWMGSRAIRSGLPAELPVIGALVESGLQNLPAGDADSAGFFQMRVSIWNQGDYAGYPDNPDLQVKWFADQSLAANQRRVGSGLPPYGEDSSKWGQWVADVLRPPDQYRGRYQLRLAEAQALLAAGCPGALPLPPDSTPPLVTLSAKRAQDPVRRRAIVVEVTCPVEACVASARGSLSLPGASRIYTFRSAARQIAAGGSAKLSLPVRPRARRAIKRALRRHRRLRVKISVTVKDAAGNAATTARAVTVKHRR